MQLYSGFKIYVYKDFIGEISDYQEDVVLTSREFSNKIYPYNWQIIVAIVVQKLITPDILTSMHLILFGLELQLAEADRWT